MTSMEERAEAKARALQWARNRCSSCIPPTYCHQHRGDKKPQKVFVPASSVVRCSGATSECAELLQAMNPGESSTLQDIHLHNWWISKLPFLVQYEIHRLWNSLVNGNVDFEKLQLDLERSSSQTDQCNLISTLAKCPVSYDAEGEQLKFRGDFQKGRIVLLSPTTANDTRIYRKFGSHRFLHLNVLHITENCELLSNFRPSVAGRQYNLLWATATTSPQVHIYFAERGAGIEQIDEVLASEVAAWCIPPSLNENLTIGKKIKRLKLWFSSTTPAGILPLHSVEQIDDIYSTSGKLMTDGCGLVSREAIDFIWLHYVRNSRRHLECTGSVTEERTCPYSSFQGRLGGLKGLWVLDESLGSGIHVQFRQSQLKFHVPMRSGIGGRIHVGSGKPPWEYDEFYDTMEIVSWDECNIANHGAKLNIRFIQLLERRGVPTGYFKLCVDRALERLDKMSGDDGEILKFAKEKAVITDSNDMLDANLLFTLASANIPRDEPFFTALLQKEIGFEIDNMIMKGKYPVPMSSYLRMIPDHTQLLKEGETFLAVDPTFVPKNVSHLIAIRNPSFFPENVIKLELVSRYQLRNRATEANNIDAYSFFTEIKVGLVLSTRGETSAADEMSGGDFDGDVAWVCWDEQLVSHVAERRHLDLGEEQEQAAEDNVPATLCGEECTKQIVHYSRAFRDHDKNLRQLSFALDVALDKCAANDRDLFDIGRKAFRQVDHPYHISALRLTASQEAQFLYGPVPHWLVKAKKNRVPRYISKTALGELYDYIKEKQKLVSLTANKETASYMNPHVMTVIEEYYNRECSLDTVSNVTARLKIMRDCMKGALIRYNHELSDILKVYNGDESKRSERDAAVKRLHLCWKLNLFGDMTSEDEKLLHAAILYEQTQKYSIEKNKVYQFAWVIAHDYLTRIIADGENKTSGLGAATTVARSHQRLLFGRRSRTQKTGSA